MPSALPATKNAAATAEPFRQRQPATRAAPRPSTRPTLRSTKNSTLRIESLKVEFRTEFYNLFNHTNLYLPGSSLGGTLGGAPTSGGQITSTFEPRIIQFGLKILY